jgi:hypothetical protein
MHACFQGMHAAHGFDDNLSIVGLSSAPQDGFVGPGNWAVTAG